VDDYLECFAEPAFEENEEMEMSMWLQARFRALHYISNVLSHLLKNIYISWKLWYNNIAL
jgi:hypothetical protein